jgi:RHS repeat-associated protein
VPQGHEYLRTWTGSLEVYDSIIDMNGDGKLDLVQSGPFPWKVYFGENDGTDDFAFAGSPVLWSGDNSYAGGQIRNVWVTTGPCDENGWACTVIDTFDITGDGRTDYVVASDAGQPWRVHVGELKADGTWGFATQPISWPAPDHMMRRTKDGHIYRDTIDVNGDGLPDFVDVAGGVWSVWLNNGLGFESTPLPYFPAPVPSIGFESDGSTRHMLADFDGDGLADLLEHVDAGDEGCAADGSQFRHDCLLVYRNTGQGFTNAPQTVELPLWPSGLTVREDGAVIADLVDVSGDGLPDWVEQSADGQTWHVLLNLGGRLSPVAYEAAAPHDAYAAVVWPGGAGPLRKNSGQRTEIDLVDLNGDGFLDRVVAGDLMWDVQLNLLTQKPKLLSMMENGLGGTNTIVYAPTSRFDHGGGDGQPDLPFVAWVTAGTRLNDGLCTPPPGANVFDRQENPCIDDGHEIVSFFDYQDGRLDVEYAFDGGGNPIEVLDRGFYGFRRVTRRDVDGNETASIYGQGPLVRGRLLELYFYAGDSESGDIVRYEVNAWASRPASAHRDQVWLQRNGRFTFDLGGVPHIVVTENHDVDDYGNVLHTSVLGSHRSPVHTFTEYATAFGANGCFPRNKPSSQRTEDDGGILDQRRFFYDGAPHGTLSTGNLTAVQAWLDTASTWVTTQHRYDTYGNLIAMRDPLGHETTFDFDDTHGTFLHPLVETNAVGHQTVTAVDYRYGKPAATWGADGPATASLFTYDAAGRLICEARPGTGPGSCSLATTYVFAGGPGELSSVTVEQKQSGYATGRRTTAYFDALGRRRHSDVRAVVGGAVQTVRREQVEYDAGGRVREKFYPYPASAGAPSNGSTTFDYRLNGGSRIDPLGRVHRTAHPDGEETIVEYRGDRTVTFDEEGHRTDRVYDALLRTVREDAYDGAGVYSSTASVYDGMGRPIATHQNDDALPVKSFDYDSLGRRVAVNDRDSGLWRYGYDHAGNLVYRDDPKPDQHVQYCYDPVGRPLRACALPEDYHATYPCALVCAEDETRYTYDDAAVPFSRGRLTAVTDEAGSFRVLAYDARGRQSSTERAITVDGETTVARFQYEYNETDEVVAIHYPDGEVVTTTYDQGGRPITLQNHEGHVYVSAVWYDLFGRARSIWHGNGARDDRSYFGAGNRHRLSTVATSIGSHAALTLLYQYTPRGQISAIHDFDTGPSSNTASYEYDALGRLTRFDHSYDANDQVYEYDAWGNMTRRGPLRFSFGDPAAPQTRPHQMTALNGNPISHDANGNRTRNGSSSTYSFDAEDRLETVQWSGRTVEFVYDHEGVRRARIFDDGTARKITRYYNDLIHTAADGSTVKSYFIGGVRVASRRGDDGGWAVAGGAAAASVRVASAWHGRPIMLLELGETAQQAALVATLLLLLAAVAAPRRRSRRAAGVRVRRGQAAAAAAVFALTVAPWPIVVRPAAAQCGGPTPTPTPAPAISHFHTDHLGSTQMITDETGDVVEHVRYLPYGLVRGRWDGAGNVIAAPSAGDVRFEYTGHERDTHSGLIYAGARFYDPLLGSFLSPDPESEFTSPYSYVGWDPVNGSDPTGRCELFCLLVISFVVGFAIGLAEAALSGASLGDALKAGLINGATSVLGGAVLGPAGNALSGIDGWGRVVSSALRLASYGYGIYNTVEAFRDGEYLAGTRGALQVLSAAFGGLSDSNSGIGAKESKLPSSPSPALNAAAGEAASVRMSTLAGTFPPQPPSGTVATARLSTVTIFGIKIEIGTAWAIDSAGNRQVFDIFAVGFETEVFEISGAQALQITDAASVGDLAGQSTTLGGSGGPTGIGFGADYNVGTNYSGVTVYTGAQYGISPIGAYGMRETWTPRPP